VYFSPAHQHAEKFAQEKLRIDGVVQRSDIVAQVQEVLGTEPLVGPIDYISVASRETMEELPQVTQDGAILSVALKFGGKRMIDNVVILPLPVIEFG
jgi:pantothenate synthetase